jgi:sigma-B regulation protein RsbU (phosphoserine phosphatase)
MNGSPISGFSTLDLLRMLGGVLIAAAGLVACLLYFVRLKRRDNSLLYFGLAAALYGVRVFIEGATSYMDHQWDRLPLVISLFVAIPLILFFRLITASPFWKLVSYYLVGLFGAIAVFGIGRILLHRDLRLVQLLINTSALFAIPPLLAMLFIPFRSANRDQTILRIGIFIFALFVVYTNLVNIKVIPGNSDLEFIGFIFFLASVGFVAASRTQRNEERLLSLNKEMEIARGIQAGLLPDKIFPSRGLLRPADTFLPVPSPATFMIFCPKTEVWAY